VRKRIVRIQRKRFSDNSSDRTGTGIGASTNRSYQPSCHKRQLWTLPERFSVRDVVEAHLRSSCAQIAPSDVVLNCERTGHHLIELVGSQFAS